MKKHFTSREEFETYIARTGQDNDTYPDVYLGHTTTNFASAYDISYTDYMTEKAYMFRRYDEYCDWMAYDDEYDETFEQFMTNHGSDDEFYHSLYVDWIRQEAYATEHDLSLYTWNEILRLIQKAGTLITAEDYVRSQS